MGVRCGRALGPPCVCVWAETGLLKGRAWLHLLASASVAMRLHIV